MHSFCSAVNFANLLGLKNLKIPNMANIVQMHLAQFDSGIHNSLFKILPQESFPLKGTQSAFL